MVFASILILLRSLKFKIYLIYCQLSRYHFCKIMFTIVSQCHRSVPFDPCTTSAFRLHPSDLRPPTSDFIPQTSDLRLHPSDLSLPTSDIIKSPCFLRYGNSHAGAVQRFLNLGQQFCKIQPQMI